MESSTKWKVVGLLQNLIMRMAFSSRKREKLRRTNSSSFLLATISIVLVILISTSNSNALVFKNGLPEYIESQQSGRSLIGPGGVILDIPKIRVVRYKVRSFDPRVVSDELDCEGGECGDIVEPPVNKLHLGTNTAKELNEWSVPQNVTKLVLECKSRSGVVEWTYEGSGLMDDVEVENTRHVGDFWSASTYLHVSTLTFNRVTDRLTGKYTCKNVEKTSKSNSFYLFVPQPRSEVINDGRRIEVIPPSHADEVVLPCKMEKRQTPIHLFRKSPDGAYRKMMLHGGSRYDPYQGFILPVTQDVFGEYACKVDKKRRKKNKRSAPPSIAMLPPSPAPIQSDPQKSSASSPGFSAFPNSEELAEIVKTEEDAILLASLLASASGEHPATVPPEKAVPPIPTSTPVPTRITIIQSQPVPMNTSQDIQEIASFTPYKHRNKQRLLHRRRKRPFPRRRQGQGSAGAANGMPNTITRRQGGLPPIHPHPHFGGQIPMRTPFLKNRRPVFPHNLHRPPMSPILANPSSVPGEAIVPSATSSSGAPLSLPVVLNQPFHRSHYYGSKHHHHLPPQHSHGSPPPPPPPGLSHARLPPSPHYSSEIFEDKIPGSQEPLLPNPHTNFIAETLMSRIDGSGKYPTTKVTTKKPVSLFPQNLLPPTMTVVHTMQCVLKKMVLGADVPCNASLTDGIAERHGATPSSSNSNLNSITEAPFVKEQKTILEVAILPPPENKFFPASSKIFTTTPFFVKWETRFTDYANWAQVNHSLREGAFKRHRAEEVADFENGVNALEIFDLPEGETGNITVTYMGGRKEIRTHTWHYLIINSTVASNVGLKQTVDGVVKVFMCRSATSKRPLLSLSRLTENGCPEESKDPFSGAQDYTEEDCGLGCSLLRTKIDQGIVKCMGDGVDQTLMFPEEMQCTGRPYFIDRGKTRNLTLEEKGNRLLIPCVINNPNADVYLFHEENGMMVEVTDNSTYDLKAGFYLDTKHLDDPYGVYLCTSTPDTDDESDMVRYHVTPLEDSVFHPPFENVYGSPPFKFMWESTEEFEVQNNSLGRFDKGMFAKSANSRPHVGTFEVFKNVTGGMVRVLRKSDRKVVHTWRFRSLSRVGLSLDKERNLFRCQAQTDNQPMLYAVPCDNPNECKMERKHFDEEDEDIKSGRENSHCGDGCVQLKIWRNKPLGFVRCKGDGVDETLQYFLTENSTIVTEEDKTSIDRLRQPEILNGVRRLRVGETADFICKANRYFYSKGFQWAIETKNGQKKFIDAKVREDVFVRDEVRSVINLKILDSEWKSVWCYTPELTSNQWANVSQPIYLR